MHEITVTSTFTASHAIALPGGKQEPMHDHDWQVEITVSSNQLDEFDMVMDFHQLKNLLDSAVSNLAGQCLNHVKPFDTARIYPTAERIVELLAGTIINRLPEHVALQSVQVTESPCCRATWRAK